MIINEGFVEDIIHLALLKEKGKISEEQLVELFDLLDGLDRQELGEVYTTILYGSGYSSKLSICYEESQHVGFDAVELLFNLDSMGEDLKKGINKLIIENKIL